MSAERFLDGLARTLAEPMPRRHAVRVIGISLASLAVPALAPRRARAQVGCTKGRCGLDQRCCQKGAEENFETYCCPSPSWQILCGSQANGYRCVTTCKGGKSFACTALIAHSESGINGICCDRRIHSGCARVGPPAEKRPDGTRVPSQEWKPSCCPKGPGFGFCGGVCCGPPNRCKNGVCRCPDGTASLDGRRCCKRGRRPETCYSAGTATGSGADFGESLDYEPVGRKCCPDGSGCCGTTCCRGRGCCGTQCCPIKTSRCALSKGGKVCCPKTRLTTNGTDWLCCPVGTVPAPWSDAACCPPGAPDCCGPRTGPAVRCGTRQICVRGQCVGA